MRNHVHLGADGAILHPTTPVGIKQHLEDDHELGGFGTTFANMLGLHVSEHEDFIADGWGHVTGKMYNVNTGKVEHTFSSRVVR